MNQVTTTIDGKTGEIVATGNFRNDLKKMEREISDALPKHIPVDRFMRVVLTAVNMNPDLVKADQRSLLGSAMKAAQDGLLPDGRDGAFVVFNSKDGKDERGKDRWIAKVQWMPMIGGILKKARNSGDIASIGAEVVYKNDKFSYRPHVDEVPQHEPDWFGDRGDPLGVYAVCKTKDGATYVEIMSLAQVEKVRAVSKAGSNAYGPWAQWWDEMAKKTVLKRLAKRLPTSADLDDLLRRDDDLYDFKGNREDAPPSTFKPVANPLKDQPAIEERAQDQVTDQTDEQEQRDPADLFQGTAKDFASADLVISRSGKVLKDRGEQPGNIIDERYTGSDSLFGSLEEWIKVCGENKMSTEFSEWSKKPKPAARTVAGATEQGIGRDGETDYDPDSGEGSRTAADEGPQSTAAKAPASAASAQPGQAAARAAPKTVTARTFEGDEDYVTYMRDIFDRASSKTAINEAWNGTREDRKELLGVEQIDALTAARDEALKRFAKPGAV